VEQAKYYGMDNGHSLAIEFRLLNYDWGLDRSTEKPWPIEMATKIYSPFFNSQKNFNFFFYIGDQI
jgi:hypothetical protein